MREQKSWLICRTRGNIELTMRKELIDILICLVCREKLELGVDEKNEKEVVSGSLYCPRC